MAGSPRSRVKGGVIKARLEFVRARAGEAGLESVLSRLSREDQEVLRGWILPTTWYPLDVNLRLDDAIAAILSAGDRDRIFVEMGRASADSNLGGPQRPYLREGDPHYLLRATSAIFLAYYQVGRRTYERTGDTSAVLRTYDAENVTHTDCLTVVGWHQRAIELCGGKAVRVTETLCRTRGDPHCEYRCEWT
jgi:uncharacterized protein (TIGR02265 family)